MGMDSGAGVSVLEMACCVGVSVMVGDMVCVLLSVNVIVRVISTTGDEVAKGSVVVGTSVIVSVGGIFFVLVGPAAAVCDAIILAVKATTVGICSSGISVGKGSDCWLNAQLLDDPSTINSMINKTILVLNCSTRFAEWGRSDIAGGIFFNNC